jgi:hypothetical protein
MINVGCKVIHAIHDYGKGKVLRISKKSAYVHWNKSGTGTYYSINSLILAEE